MVMGCIHLAFTLGLFSLGGERVARERRESDQLDCSRDSDQLDRSLSRLLPQTLLPNAKGTHSSTSIACLLDQSRGKLPPPFVIDLVDLLRWRRIYSRGTRASTSLSQRSSPVPYSGLPGTSRSNTTVGNRLFKPEPGSSNQNLMPTTTETRSSPSSSRQFRLPGAPCWTPTASLLLRTASTSPTPPRYHRPRVAAQAQASTDVRVPGWISRAARPLALESPGRSTRRLAHAPAPALALAASEQRRALAVTDRTRQRAASPPFALALAPPPFAISLAPSRPFAISLAPSALALALAPSLALSWAPLSLTNSASTTRS